MTLATGAASKLKRKTMLAAATRVVPAPEEKPIPVITGVQEPSLNGSLPPFQASPRMFPPLPDVGTSTKAGAPAVRRVTLLDTESKPKETLGTWLGYLGENCVAMDRSGLTSARYSPSGSRPKLVCRGRPGVRRSFPEANTTM